MTDIFDLRVKDSQLSKLRSMFAEFKKDGKKFEEALDEIQAWRVVHFDTLTDQDIRAALIKVYELLSNTPTPDKELGGVKFADPQGYEIEERNIYKMIQTPEEGVVRRAIFPAPILITAMIEDAEVNTEEIKIRFWRRTRWQELIVTRHAISDPKKLVELSNFGLPVNSLNGKELVSFLFAYLKANDVPVSYVARGSGWKEVQGGKIFILDTAVTDREEVPVTIKPDPGFERFVRAMKPKGDFSTWKAVVQKTLKYPFAAFAFFASFVPPLQKLIKAPNFIIDFWGTTSVGKTTVLELAASVWGNPHKETGGLIFAWDSTKVFMERLAEFFCDVPLFPDDSQTVPEKIITQVMYQIANGTGKGRGNVSGIRHTPTWHTVCFSTGERPLTECTKNAGARARTVSLYGTPFPQADGAFINELKSVLRENYGHAGRLYVQQLLAFWNKAGKRGELRRKYLDYQAELSTLKKSEIADRYSHFFAAVKVAADLVVDYLQIGNPAEVRIQIDQIFLHSIKQIHEADITIRAMTDLLSFAFSKKNDFETPVSLGGDSSRTGRGQSPGLWRQDDYIAFYKTVADEFLYEKGYSPAMVYESLAAKNWIKASADSVTYPVGIGNVKIRMIKIPWASLKSSGFMSENG